VTSGYARRRRCARARSAFVSKRAILNSILDGIGEGVIVVDALGRTLLFNSEAQRVLGAQARDVPPEQWASAYGVYLADGRTLVPPAENPLVRAMHGVRKVEMEGIIKSGGVSEARVAIVATPLRNDNGEVTGAIALLRDVTQKRSLEQLLVHSQKMEAVGQLAGGRRARLQQPFGRDRGQR